MKPWFQRDESGFFPPQRDETRFHPSNLSAETIEISTHKGDDAILVSSSISCVNIIIIIETKASEA